jgi:hypothetical protein
MPQQDSGADAGNDPQLVSFTVSESDPQGIFEQLDAMRASAIRRWDTLIATFPCRHYFQAEVAFRIMFLPEGAVEQEKINQQQIRVIGWLEANLKEGVDYELEGTGVSSDFHIFFKSAAIYQRFCEDTGESPQVPSK